MHRYLYHVCAVIFQGGEKRMILMNIPSSSTTHRRTSGSYQAYEPVWNFPNCDKCHNFFYWHFSYPVSKFIWHQCHHLICNYATRHDTCQNLKGKLFHRRAILSYHALWILWFSPGTPATHPMWLVGLHWNPKNRPSKKAKSITYWPFFAKLFHLHIFYSLALADLYLC